MTVTELLDHLQALEADGKGEAVLHAYLGAKGLRVQAEGSADTGLDALVGVLFTAPLEITAGAQVVAP